MSAFLFLLIKWNLAMAAAIVLAALLRRPLRLLFGAPIAYAVWFAVPIASLAILLPPRVAAPMSVTAAQYAAAPISAISQIAQPALRITGQLTQSTPAAARAASSGYAAPDGTFLLFAAWALGALLAALYLIRLQLRFSAAMRQGEAGPAVLGFFRPRIVTPDNFQDSFTSQEQAAILAHERIHLARQDARINALTALLRCVCWFNPLIHLGARWLRIDQELACDAAAVAGTISRRDYANALLKSQMIVAALPLGCNWPGSKHPLVERIALLKRKPPGAARRIVGVGLVMLAAASIGLSAWAAQPPVAPDSIAAPIKPIALASPSAPSRNIAVVPTQPIVDANPIASGHHVDAAMDVHSETPAPPLSQGQPNVAVATAMASNSPPAAPAQPASEISPVAAVTPNDQPVAPSAPQNAPAGPVQEGLSTPPATLPNFDPNKPYRIRTCTGTVTGRATSSTTFQMPGIACGGFSGGFPETDGGGMSGGSGSAGGDGGISFGVGPCKRPRTLWGAMASVPVPVPNCKPWLTMTVEFANPADASKMPLGKLVRLKGDFRLIIQNKVRYLLMQNARVLYVDPFGR